MDPGRGGVVGSACVQGGPTPAESARLAFERFDLPERLRLLGSSQLSTSIGASSVPVGGKEGRRRDSSISMDSPCVGDTGDTLCVAGCVVIHPAGSVFWVAGCVATHPTGDVPGPVNNTAHRESGAAAVSSVVVCPAGTSTSIAPIATAGFPEGLASVPGALAVGDCVSTSFGTVPPTMGCREGPAALLDSLSVLPATTGSRDGPAMLLDSFGTPPSPVGGSEGPVSSSMTSAALLILPLALGLGRGFAAAFGFAGALAFALGFPLPASGASSPPPSFATISASPSVSTPGVLEAREVEGVTDLDIEVNAAFFATPLAVRVFGGP